MSTSARTDEAHKPWFDEECIKLLDQRKQAIMQWVQDPSQSNVDNLNNVRSGASRHFGNKKKAYLKTKLRNLKLILSKKILSACMGVSVT